MSEGMKVRALLRHLSVSTSRSLVGSSSSSRLPLCRSTHASCSLLRSPPAQHNQGHTPVHVEGVCWGRR